MRLIDPFSFLSFFFLIVFLMYNGNSNLVRRNLDILFCCGKFNLGLIHFSLRKTFAFYILVITNEIYTLVPCVLHIICLDFCIKNC